MKNINKNIYYYNWIFSFILIDFHKKIESGFSSVGRAIDCRQGVPGSNPGSWIFFIELIINNISEYTLFFFYI